MWIRSALWIGRSQDEKFFRSEVQRVSLRMDAMLGAPERADVRKEIAQAAVTFRGTVTHIDFEVGG